jgi:2,6-dihydroxypseudooxynicotine hydrolase
VRSHARTPEQGRANALTLSLAGVAERIACPIYIVAGKLDRVIPWQDAERLAREVKGPVVFSLIEDGNHVANNRGYKWRLQTADWTADQLGCEHLLSS